MGHDCIQKVELALALGGHIEDELGVIALVFHPAICHKVLDSLTQNALS